MQQYGRDPKFGLTPNLVRQFGIQSTECRGAPTPGASEPSPFRYLRTIRCTDSELFDLIFEIQDYSYRRNRFIKGRVWSYSTFFERSANYIIFGSLPHRDANGRLPTLCESFDQRAGFILGRFLPTGSAHPWLKLSAIAGHAAGIMAGYGEALVCGFPIIAAVEPRLARIVIQAGLRTLPPVLARLLLPIVAPAFIQPPWTYHGVLSNGDIEVTNPEFRDLSTGKLFVYTKKIVLSPGALIWFFRPKGIASTLRLIFESIGNRAAKDAKELQDRIATETDARS